MSLMQAGGLDRRIASGESGRERSESDKSETNQNRSSSPPRKPRRTPWPKKPTRSATYACPWCEDKVPIGRVAEHFKECPARRDG